MVIRVAFDRDRLEKRKRHDMSKRVMNAARRLTDDKNVSGYTLVVWDKNYNFRTLWNCGGTMSASVMPEFVKNVLERNRNILDTTALPPEFTKDDA